MKDEEDAVETFYRTVAEMLGCDDHYHPFPFRKRTRWNNRSAGNGRFQGHGLVRYFGPSHIQVSLKTPAITGLFDNADDALRAIAEVKARELDAKVVQVARLAPHAVSDEVLGQP